MDDSETFFAGIMCMIVLIVVFLAGAATGSGHQNTRIDKAIICMEGTSDPSFCRSQAGLIVSNLK